MQPKITETIELMITYHPNGTDERVNLPDLLDVLTEGSKSILPVGATPAPPCLFIATSKSTYVGVA